MEQLFMANYFSKDDDNGLVFPDTDIEKPLGKSFVKFSKDMNYSLVCWEVMKKSK